MKDMPPSRARAIAMVSLDTACMIAETIGILMEIGHSSTPLRYFTIGVFRSTFAGMHLLEEYPGTSRYSLKVWDGSEK